MEIHALKMSLSEQDLNDLIQKNLPPDQPLEDVKISLTPEGVQVKGVYPLFLDVNFETHWDVGVKEGKVAARLTGLRALGIPTNIFKSAIMKIIAEFAGKEDWLAIDQDTIWLDVDVLLLKNGLRGRSNLSRIQCQAGHIIIESMQLEVSHFQNDRDG